MQIVEVKTPQHKQLFLQVPVLIYKNDVNWIRPLDKDIEQVFNTEKNKFFRHGTCTRWLLFDDKKMPIGRVAAFINNKTANKNEQPTGGMGFFECINDKQAAFLLFDRCKNWLKEKGMEAMDGPINFGERDAWWGLLVDGFTPIPYKMNYNPPYYKNFFEEYGFKIYFNQLCYSLDPQKRVQDKIYARHAEIKANPDYRYEHLHKNNMDKYAEDFRVVYNKAWVKHGGGKELDSKQVRQFFKTMKTIVDGTAISYVYYKNEPVACWINIPDINQIFKFFNGKLGVIEKLRFMWHLKTGKIKKLIGIVFGVVPEHHGKGVDSFMIVEAANRIQKEKRYFDFEIQWVGDFNPKMISVAESLGTFKSRTLTTYRYLFDREKKFKRHPIL